MGLPNKFEITYGARAVGGASTTYLLDGPYVIEKSFDGIRFAFSVLVVADGYDTLLSLSEALEEDFRKRDQSFTISLDGNESAYTFGDNVLKTTAAAIKSGSPITDRGFSRAYACTISGELPADDTDGLRELNVTISYAAGRRRTVTVTGTYTAIDGTSATDQYEAEFPAEMTAILADIDGAATWEKVSEDVQRDRTNQTAQFMQQHVELLANQSIGLLDDPDIRDHQLTFRMLSAHGGDSEPNILRLRHVESAFSCSVDITETTNLAEVLDRVRLYVRQEFQVSYSPSQFAVENEHHVMDQTGKRIELAIRFLYVPAGATATLESNIAVAYSKQANIDYTYIHDGGTLSAYADHGWEIKTRTWSRNATLLGSLPATGQTPATSAAFSPQRSSTYSAMLGGASSASAAPSNPTATPADAFLGAFVDNQASQSLGEGWNVIAANSQNVTHYVGDTSKGDPQIQLNFIQESVTQRYHTKPRGVRRGT